MRLMRSENPRFRGARPRATEVKRFCGPFLSVTSRSKKKDDTRRPASWQRFATECAIELFPVPARSDNKNISADFVSSADSIQVQMSSRRAARVPGRHPDSKSHDAPFANGSVSDADASDSKQCIPI